MTRRDPLATLLRLRQTTLDETRKAVAEAHRAEQDAGALLEQAERALGVEARAALSLVHGDEQVESYARWLPIGRRAVERAHGQHRTATVELDRARAMLALARAGFRAVEKQVEARDAAEAEREGRQDQRAADEVAGVIHLSRMARGEEP
ncbi:MAG: hypothetical protein INR65_03285 [Gluconacetobacter diazotrophicus]|nr:hypothetical protein [Gluconacetobacter diazotrophicus]